MMKETFRRLAASSCSCSWCDSPAVLVRQWRTHLMPSTAHWYYCEECEERELWADVLDARDAALTAGERNR